jgi:hypothetical protein
MRSADCIIRCDSSSLVCDFCWPLRSSKCSYHKNYARGVRCGDFAGQAYGPQRPTQELGLWGLKYSVICGRNASYLLAIKFREPYYKYCTGVMGMGGRYEGTVFSRCRSGWEASSSELLPYGFVKYREIFLCSQLCKIVHRAYLP